MAEPQHRRRIAPAARRLELIETAERLIRARGLDVKVDDVAAAAGASRATFYVYFDNWEDLLLALRERAVAQLEQDLEAALALRSDWRDLINALPEMFIALTLALEGLHTALFHGPIAQIPPSADVILRLRRLLRDGVEADGLTCSDPALAARFLFATLHEAADLVLAGGDRRRIADGFGALLVSAFLARGTPFDAVQPR